MEHPDADCRPGTPRLSASVRCRRVGPALVAVAAFTLAGIWPGISAADSPIVGQQLRQRCVEVLRRGLNDEQGPTRAAAAEYLLRLDYWDGVQDRFEAERERFESRPEERIRIWRVLALAPVEEKKRDAWIAKIRDVFLDPGAPDRLEAVEALAALGYRVPEDEAEPFAEAARSDDGRMAALASWVLLNSGQQEGEARLAELLWGGTKLIEIPNEAGDPQARAAAAYALRHVAHAQRDTRLALGTVAVAEPSDSPWRVFLVGAALVHYHEGEHEASKRPFLTQLKRRLRSFAMTGSEAERREACETLGIVGRKDDLPILTGLLEDADADVRHAAAWAILRIGRRVPRRIPLLDWGVIGVYAIGMLAVGWYYSKRVRTTEDYLLGGRKMKPLGVGLSLFASLLSTISYLTWPGEMVKYGPLFMLGAMAAYLPIYLVVGWFLIPFIMKLKVTSAYEILETRLGTSVRMLGSFLFLLLRLGWMGVIIFATSDKVLVPLMGWPSSATPYVCVVLGAITVIYTSMGGLRAVVLTDVVQTLILFGGALLSLILVTTYLGSVGAWWPTAWPAHWPDPVWGYAPGARITFFGGFLATFTWYVCTSGSDQMAIQRYLATRDLKAARNVMGVSLVANALVSLVMMGVGLAIMAYFRANPHLVPDGQRMLTDADSLFPSFIGLAMPVGLSGLVVAGLLAAAMSSLSSGVNSSCSVITVDFVDRFRTSRESEIDHVKLAKYVSVLVGVVVVALSSGVGMVQGNLLEVAFKVVNLLTAPLFGLFFMAMFVRWATGPGTIVGAVFGLAVVVAINYWKEITGSEGISFLWAMPLSFVVQIGVGMMVSLVPVGRRKGQALE